MLTIYCLFTALQLPFKNHQAINGREIRIVGKGPPVVFSPGLYGSMHPSMYNQFIHNLKDKISVITLGGLGIIRKKDIEEISIIIGVEKIGLLTHSSFDYNALSSPIIEKAVLLDPITLPDISTESMDIQNKIIESLVPTMVLYANLSKEIDKAFVLPGFGPEIVGNDVEHITYDNVGHTDILDNIWAETGKMLGIHGLSDFQKEFLSYESWKNNKYSKKSETVTKARNVYRNMISNNIKTFFTESLKKKEIEHSIQV